MKDSSNVSERELQPPAVGISVVIFALDMNNENSDLFPAMQIPLVRRIRQPYIGKWALPGSNLRGGVSLETMARDALESTTRLQPEYLEQLCTFGDPDRSGSALPMVSIVYWALIDSSELANSNAKNPNAKNMQSAGFEPVENVRFFPVDSLPELAFDHRMIIDYAVERARNKIEYSDLATRLVGEEFTLRQLRSVYEAVRGQSMDPANFRRKMLASGLLKPTGEKLKSTKHRPAALYRYVFSSSVRSSGVRDFDIRGSDAYSSGGRGLNHSISHAPL